MSSAATSRKAKRKHADSGAVHRKASGAVITGDAQVLERCTGCTVEGDDAVLIECTGCVVKGNGAVVFQSTGCTTTGDNCRFIKCTGADDKGKAARMVDSSLKSSERDGVVTVGRGIGTQTAPAAAQDIGALMGLKPIPDGERTVKMTIGSISAGRNCVVMRGTADGRMFVNGVEVPKGTTTYDGKLFYKGKQVTRGDKALLEEMPAFGLALDSIASGKGYEEPRQVQIVHSNGVRSMYTGSGGIQNFF